MVREFTPEERRVALERLRTEQLDLLPDEVLDDIGFHTDGTLEETPKEPTPEVTIALGESAVAKPSKKRGEISERTKQRNKKIEKRIADNVDPWGR